MIIVRQLETRAEIEDACALLYKEYIDYGDGWNFGEDNPVGLKVITDKINRKLLVDNVTEYAVWFGAFDGNRLVGCIRLFKSTDAMPFEIEHYESAQKIVDLYIKLRKSDIYEGGRVCVDSAYKGKKILLYLYRAILEYANNKQFAVFGTTSKEYIKGVLRKIGWPCKEENSFKFEASDLSPVNFYLIEHANGEINKAIEKICILESSRITKEVNIFDALNLVAPIFPAPMYWHDTRGRVIGANLKCLTGMNKLADEVIGKTPYDFYPHDIAEYIWNHSKLVIDSGETLSQEEYSYDDLGNIIGIYLAIKSPLYDELNNCIGVIGASVDITAEKEAEQLKRENEKQKLQLEVNQDFAKCLEEMQHLIQYYKMNNLNKQLKHHSIDNGSELPLVKKDIKLTKREREIIYFLSLNKSPKDIATILSVIENKTLASSTISSIIDKQLYPKFNVSSVGQLIEVANALKLIPFTLTNG